MTIVFYKIKTMKCLLALIAGFIFISFLPPKMVLSQSLQKNEISFHTNLVRGGFEPYDFFDGTAIGFLYNREVFPYVMVHTNFVAVQLFNGYDWINHNHNNGLINSDIGIEIAPFEFKKFQVRFVVAGSLQIRNSVEPLDPELLTSFGGADYSTIYSFRSYHFGYKFELKLPVQISERFFAAPITTMRTYPKGNYTPDIFEVGIQGGIKF